MMNINRLTVCAICLMMWPVAAGAAESELQEPGVCVFDFSNTGADGIRSLFSNPDITPGRVPGKNDLTTGVFTTTGIPEITLCFQKGEHSAQYPWWDKDNVVLNVDNSLTLSIDDEHAITSVVFTLTDKENYQEIEFDTSDGTWDSSGLKWTAPDDGVHEATLRATLPYSRFKSLAVSYSSCKVGITDIVYASDSDIVPVYYDLHGRRVDNRALTRGIYIVHRGLSVTKQFVH